MEPSIFLAIFAVIVGSATVLWWWTTDPSRKNAGPSGPGAPPAPQAPSTRVVPVPTPAAAPTSGPGAAAAADVAPNSPPAREKPLVSLVALLSKPRPLSQQQVIAAATRAFKLTFFDSPNARCAVLPVPHPQTTLFAVVMPEIQLGVVSCSHPYVHNPAATAARLPVGYLKHVMATHGAWISIDRMGAALDAATAYPYIAKLFAEMLGPDCLGVLATEDSRFNVYSPAMADILRGPDPLAIFSQQYQLPLIHVQPQDAEMRAAEQEARERWGEFVAAFARRKQGQNFSVKAPLPTADAGQEFVWIEVRQLHPDRIIGALANTPINVPGKQFGDAVQVAVDQVEDWMYTRDRDIVGGFTVKVLAARRGGQSAPSGE